MADPVRNELGTTGLKRHGGHVYEEFARQLQGARKHLVYQEMRENDPVIGAILFAVDKLLRQVKWRVQPASEQSKDKKAAEFLESCMGDMEHTWEDFISEVLSMLPYGWSLHEVVYKKRNGDSKDPRKKSKYDDNKIGWRKLPIRGQETLHRWEFNEVGEIEAMWQLAPPRYDLVQIPMDRALLFRTTSAKNNPEGRSILRNAWRAWSFKKRIEEIEAIGIERDLAGFPVMYVDPAIMAGEASDEHRQVFLDYQDVIRNIRRDAQEGLILPSVFEEGHRLYELSLVSSSGERQFDTNAIIGRYDQRIATTVLADFILLGQQSHGSFAMSSDKTDLFALALRAWCEVIRGVLNEVAVPRLFEANGEKLDKLPTFEYGDVETPDLGSLGNFIQVLANSGVPLFPDPKLENYLREVANLPIKDPDEMPQPGMMPGMPGMPGAPALDPVAAARAAEGGLPAEPPAGGAAPTQAAQAANFTPSVEMDPSQRPKYRAYKEDGAWGGRR